MMRTALCLAGLLGTTLVVAQPGAPVPRVTARNFTNMPMLVTLEHGPRSGPGVCVMPGTQKTLDLDPRQPPPVLRARAAPGNTCGARPVCEASIGLAPGMHIVHFNRDGSGCSLTAANPKLGLPKPPYQSKFVEVQNDNREPVLVTFYRSSVHGLVQERRECVRPRMRMQLWVDMKAQLVSGRQAMGPGCEAPPGCQSEPTSVFPSLAWGLSGSGCAMRQAGPSDLPIQACPNGMEPPCLK